MKRVAIGACVVAAALTAQAHAADKVPVKVEHSGTDGVGQQIAFDLKEAIRASQAFRYTDSTDDAHIRVDLISLDTDRDTPNIVSSVAYAIVFDSPTTVALGVYLTAGVKRCGRSMATECARQLLPTIDGQVEWLRKSAPSLYKRLK